MLKTRNRQRFRNHNPQHQQGTLSGSLQTMQVKSLGFFAMEWAFEHPKKSTHSIGENMFRLSISLTVIALTTSAFHTSAEAQIYDRVLAQQQARQNAVQAGQVARQNASNLRGLSNQVFRPGVPSVGPVLAPNAFPFYPVSPAPFSPYPVTYNSGFTYYPGFYPNRFGFGVVSPQYYYRIGSRTRTQPSNDGRQPTGGSHYFGNPHASQYIPKQPGF